MIFSPVLKPIFKFPYQNRNGHVFFTVHRTTYQNAQNYSLSFESVLNPPHVLLSIQTVPIAHQCVTRAGGGEKEEKRNPSYYFLPKSHKIELRWKNYQFPPCSTCCLCGIVPYGTLCSVASRLILSVQLNFSHETAANE